MKISHWSRPAGSKVTKDRLERLGSDVPGQGNTIRGLYQRVTFPEGRSMDVMVITSEITEKSLYLKRRVLFDSSPLSV